jgi:Uma2 family endonuclease
MAEPLAKWTVNDYHRMVDAGILGDRRVELLEGNIVEMAPEQPIHAYFYHRVYQTLDRLLAGRAAVFPPRPIDLTQTDSEPEPDVTVCQLPYERYEHHHPSPSEIYWAVEIANTSLERDLETKARTYARAGLLEYWVVDLPHRQLIVHRQPLVEQARYAFVQTFDAGVLQPLAFPDTEVSLADLLGE